MTTITDREIKEYVKKGILISENFEPRRLKQCCYEIRSSDTFHVIGASVDRVKIDAGQDFVLKAHEKAVFISFEEFNIPPNFLARILTKGVLFSLGISAVNTYADPGFEGKLGITLHNTSPFDVKFPYNEPIAKIEFEKLNEDVTEPYSGQHGYATGIWPVPTDRILAGSLSASQSSQKTVSAHIGRVLGSEFSALYDQLFRTQRWFAFFVFGGLAINVLILALITGGNSAGFYVSVVTGFLANAGFAALSWYLGRK